jgi:hypothetical protein
VEGAEDDDQRIRQTGDEILGYLDEHPFAADSIHGVLSFWVRSGAHRGSRAIVERSLERLTEMGHVTQEPLPDGQILYRATRETERR